MTMAAYMIALLVGVGVLQCVAGLVATARFVATPTPKSTRRPPVTILKPLCGDEPLLEEALVSCCCQVYPTFQIVFGLQDPADPALAVVRRVQERFPRCDIAVVVDATRHGANRKVANLINMLPSAKHEILLISDSDLHVPANYLERLVLELEKPNTGLVTAVYVGLPMKPRWPTRLGATYISHSFLPGVLLARAMGRQDCLGSTVMLRKNTLKNSGGLRPLVSHLAEDNVLGQRIAKLGLAVRLAATVPAAGVSETSFRALWLHEIRWARTNRTLAPLAYGASSVQHPLFWAAGAIILSAGAQWSLALFVFTWVVRAVSAQGIDRVLNFPPGYPLRAVPIWLLPVRDMLSVTEIIASYWSDKVVWRGHSMAANGRPSGGLGRGSDDCL
jgi:ceramide glucosyltransferase